MDLFQLIKPFMYIICNISFVGEAANDNKREYLMQGPQHTMQLSCWRKNEALAYSLASCANEKLQSKPWLFALQSLVL